MNYLSFIILFIIGCNYNQPVDDNIKSSSYVWLDKSLREVSGLAWSGGKLYAHDDELGYIYTIDERTGKIKEKVQVGKNVVKGDFEGITIDGNNFYMITGDGDLYKIKKSGSGSFALYDKIKTGLDEKNDVEGICYDKETNSFLLACKGSAGKEYKGYKAVYSFDINKKELSQEPVILLSLDALESKYKLRDFSPSDITISNDGKSFYILSSFEKAVAQVDRKGKIIRIIKLQSKEHPQPEGITFTAKGDMLIGDEGSSRGKLTRYGLK